MQADDSALRRPVATCTMEGVRNIDRVCPPTRKWGRIMEKTGSRAAGGRPEAPAPGAQGLTDDPETLAGGVQAQERRAISRALTLAEEGGARAEALLRALGRTRRQAARVVGITGPPGAGKSSLCDRLVALWRAAGLRVAVLAVDPSSPFTGGAVLGDRVRMNAHALDAGVFIRSVGARGDRGGLARPARAAVRVFAAAGFDVIVLETVGVGQSELAVMYLADTCVLVTTPTGGDQVQAAKAGILEAADVVVVNKADLPGAAGAARDLGEALAVASAASSAEDRQSWDVPVLCASAVSGTGIAELGQAIDSHYGHLSGPPGARLTARRGRGLVEETLDLLRLRALDEIGRRSQSDETWGAVLRRVAAMDLDPDEAVRTLSGVRE